MDVDGDGVIEIDGLYACTGSGQSQSHRALIKELDADARPSSTSPASTSPASSSLA